MRNDLISTNQAVERTGLARAADLHAAAKARKIKPVHHRVRGRTLCYWRECDVDRIKKSIRARNPDVRPFPGAVTLPEYAAKVKVSRQRVHQMIKDLRARALMDEPVLFKNWRWLNAQQVVLLDKERKELKKD